MKSLFNFILPCILVLSLTSCSKYYINTVSSINMLKNKETGEFLLENDSVKISYGFAGKDAPVHVKVYNKLMVPVYVDWARSSIVFNGKAKSFVPEAIKFSGSISTDTRNISGLSLAESTMQGTVQAQKEVTFIPPNSGIEATVQVFEHELFKHFSDSLYKETDYLSTAQGTMKVKAGNFDSSNTPLAFRTYLTLFIQDGQKNTPFAFDKEFFVSKSIRTSGRPQNFFEYSLPSGDVFYNSSTTAYGKTMTGVGVAAALGAAAIVQPAEGQK